MIFSEYSDENRVILLQTVAKWRCIKRCAFLWTTSYCSIHSLLGKWNYTFAPGKNGQKRCNAILHRHGKLPQNLAII